MPGRTSRMPSGGAERSGRGRRREMHSSVAQLPERDCVCDSTAREQRAVADARVRRYYLLGTYVRVLTVLCWAWGIQG